MAAALMAVAACAGSALPVSAGYGPNPQLPKPEKQLIPTFAIPKAVGWKQGAAPTAAPGFAVKAFATGLDHPRWLYVLPDGDVLVAETNAPPKPDDHTGPSAWYAKPFMKKAGASEKSPNKILLLRDKDGDGVAETKSVFLQGLNSPFGMALVGDSLYVADTDAVLKFPYKEGETEIKEPGVKVVDLPAGTINHHWTKNLVADGKTLYVTVGSNSNAGDNGPQAEEGRAAIWQVDLATGQHRIYASGMRNPEGMDFQPDTGALWAVVQERDEIGNDLVPDYMTAVKDGAFYGWPYSYYGQHPDDRPQPPRPDLVAKAIPPDYALGAHTASMGLAFDKAGLFPASYKDGAFIGQHGSWNRKPPNGYQVIFVPFVDGQPKGDPEPVLTGFLNQDDDAYGRPVCVIFDKSGALLVADDVGNTVWRVTPAAKP
ncbi:MAG TPA: sorbosone dehydrogenase family protein [Gammaproteobacteria bacterium]|jgi:glucose/arabinose dehydrogenase